MDVVTTLGFLEGFLPTEPSHQPMGKGSWFTDGNFVLAYPYSSITGGASTLVQN